MSNFNEQTNSLKYSGIRREESGRRPSLDYFIEVNITNGVF